MTRSLLAACFVLTTLAAADAYAFKEGDVVLAHWEPANHYFVATLVEADNTIKGGGWKVVYEDGETSVVPHAKIKNNDVKVGTKVKARWKDGRFYPGTIAKIVGRALFIKYDDGDTGWASWSWIAVAP